MAPRRQVLAPGIFIECDDSGLKPPQSPVSSHSVQVKATGSKKGRGFGVGGVERAHRVLRGPATSPRVAFPTAEGIFRVDRDTLDDHDPT